MIKTEKKVKTLTWDFKKFGLFKAVIIDGELSKYEAGINGSGAILESDNVELLIAIKDSIEELLNEIDIPVKSTTSTDDSDDLPF